MTQWLRALTALAQDLGLVPNFPWWLTTVCNYSSRVSRSSFNPCRHVMHLCTLRHSHIHVHCINIVLTPPKP